MSIDDIILDRDRRGISKLRPHMPEEFCDRAAGLILDHPGTVLIVTGFYILAAGSTETDGPPGAIAMGNALQELGYEVIYTTDEHTYSYMTGLIGAKARVVDFPITDEAGSKKFANELLDEVSPSVVIGIERCGVTDEGLYRNMRGRDITAYNAKTDYLFTDHPHTVGVGDGGNEIGLGNLAQFVPTVPTLVEKPSITRTTELIISSVANWGGYGLVAALSMRHGKNLLMTVEDEREMVKQLVDMGAVDGISGEQEYKIDSFTLEENSQTLVELHEFLSQQGVSS